VVHFVPAPPFRPLTNGQAGKQRGVEGASHWSLPSCRPGPSLTFAHFIKTQRTDRNIIGAKRSRKRLLKKYGENQWRRPRGRRRPRMHPRIKPPGTKLFYDNNIGRGALPQIDNGIVKTEWFRSRQTKGTAPLTPVSPPSGLIPAESRSPMT
jgi:hypothetical protein